MKAVPLSIHWHQENQPIYSAHFEPNGKGRLATASGDNNVRLWRITGDEDKKVVYLSTLSKHTQAVNVVRFCPRGEMLASAGDDGNVILWVPSESNSTKAFGEDDFDDKETWRLKHTCRSMGSEIYDLAWSPDGEFFITGSMDNIARIYDSQSGQIIRQIAEHNHYVQGVAWDPLNEYVATQSSDRSVHIYTLKTKDGQFALHGKIAKMDLPPTRRTTSASPAPPDLTINHQQRPSMAGSDVSSNPLASPVPSAPGTPTSFSMPMNPPLKAHSRRSSFSSSPSLRPSPSPSPALPLPAIKPMDSPKLHSLGARSTNIYCNDAMTSFFRRLTFTPDGSLLLTPSGQYKVTHPTLEDGIKSADEIINTVYIYTRAGLNKPPIAHLPGHKKPSIAVSCSPVVYHFRKSTVTTKHITVDTSSGDENISLLPPPALTTESSREAPTSAPAETQTNTSGNATPSTGSGGGAAAAFSLPYRIVYAVATQDAVLIYDTQQQTPLCVVSNLHYAAFTDLTWSPDGNTLLMTSTDGFCSVVAFSPSELGTVYNGPYATTPVTPSLHNTTMAAPFEPSSNASTSNSPFPPSSAPPSRHGGPGASPARSLSSSSVTTMTSTSMSQYPQQTTDVSNNPTPLVSSVPSVGASGIASFGVPMTTPPMTPAGSSVLGKRDASSKEEGGETPKPPDFGRGAVSSSSSSTATVNDEGGNKKEGDADKKEDGGDKKRRRVVPTLVAKDKDAMKE